MTPVAYLRVYVPDEAGPVVEHVPAAGARRVLVRGAYGVWYESLRDDAFVIEQRGRRLVCPRHPRLRMLEGLLAFRHAYPPGIGESLVPETLARRAAAELAVLQADRPEARSHILTSPFHVPLRWFAAFEGKERELLRGPGGPGIRYRTSRRSALHRLQRAARVLEAAGFEDDTVALVQDLADWLQPFPPESLVELDYGGAAGLFAEDELADDESAADLAASLAALQRGDLEEAGDYYTVVAARWARAQALSFAN
ncbi:MAG: hypothetical protein H6Q11_191 [Acidobacteria bacterium]|nr:hypothetical protein [Acidobacteriota bacterium]